MIGRVARLAMSNPRVAKLLNVLAPSRGAAAIRYAPEFLYAGITPFMAPEGTSLGDRALIGLEDLGIGLTGSVLGQGVGYGAGRGILKNQGLARRLGRNASPDQIMNTAVTAGDLLVQAPVNMLSPRPMFDRAIKKSYGAQEQQVQAIDDLQRREQIEALLTAMATAGLIGGKAASPALQSKVLDPLATVLSQQAR